jgi:omega-amidase
MKISISLAQMNLVFGQPQKNLENAERMIRTAHKNQSTLILFPELWSTSHDLNDYHNHIASNVIIQKRLAVLARKYPITIGGSLLEASSDDPNNLFNVFTILQPDPASNQLPEEIKYRKIHLFRLMDEHKWMQSGEKMQTAQLPWALAGMSICYDLRFPEMFRRYALQGVQIILLVAAWPIQRIDHWKTLLRARAIENQVFMIAVNCVGNSGRTTFGGSSAVISPWGETLIEGSQIEEELLTIEIDMEQVDHVRQKLPIFDDRRPDIYG